MEQLAEEESDRRTDLELALNDREQHVHDMIKEGKIDCRADLEGATRDKHARERVAMLERLLQDSNDPKEAVAQYLKSEKRSALKDLDKFKAALEREKLAKLDDLKAQKEAREKELRDKEQHMLNWEDRVREEEAKAMQAFQLQKEGILARQLDKQQQELALEVNQEDINALLEKHERERNTLKTALEIEEKRQRDNMQAKLKSKLDKLRVTEEATVRKEIKMAKLREIKEKQMAHAMKNTGFSGSAPQVVDANKLQTLTEKVRVMREPITKYVYSQHVEDIESHRLKLRFFRKQFPALAQGDAALRQAMREQDGKANEANADIASIRKGARNSSTMLVGSDEGEELSLLEEEARMGPGYITFKELLEKVGGIEA